MRRRRVLTLVGVAVVAAALVATLVVVLRPERLPSLADVPALVNPADCTVAGVDLDRDQAEKLTSNAARARRSGGSVRAAVADLVPGERLGSVTRALNGRSKAALTCRAEPSSSAARPRLGPNGLTARADAVRLDVDRRFGALPVGGFAPGGVSSGHQKGSAHYEGRAVDIFVRPVSSSNKVRGWALAHYLVAHADRLQVETVIFDGRIWSRWRSVQGWRTYEVDSAGAARRTRAILEHRDHVHVDVS